METVPTPPSQGLPHSPSADRDFIYVPEIDNVSDFGSVKSLDHHSENSDSSAATVGKNGKSWKSSDSSFTDVNDTELEPKLEKGDHDLDVPTLMAEAQSENVYADYEENDCMRFTNGQSFMQVNDSLEQERPLDLGDICLENIGEDAENADADTPVCSGSPETEDADGRTHRSSSDSSGSKDACIMFHGITYLGSATVNAPVSEIELKRTLSILRDHTEVSIDVILALGLSLDGVVRLIDPESRTDIATYETQKIWFWGKGDDETPEKDCVAFNIAHGNAEMFHCHVFKCNDIDEATKISQSLSQILKTDKKRRQTCLPGTKLSRLDPCDLTFKYDITLDILEDDGKGSYMPVARDKNCFKLRKSLQKRIVFVIEQLSNKVLSIERCFGLFVCPGKNVKETDMLLLDQVQMEGREYGKIHLITGKWDPTTESGNVLNTETPKDTKVFFTVAVDLVFSALKEPVRIVKETKVRVYSAQEKFWNPAKPRVHEEFALELREGYTDSGEKYYELCSLQAANDMPNTDRSGSVVSFRRRSRKGTIRPTKNDDEEPANEDEDDDEPLLSGSGEVELDYSEEELTSWSEVLSKWEKSGMRPKNLIQLVRKGVPNPKRGQLWQMLVAVDDENDVRSSYSYLATKESPAEQVIVWDVMRTFPAHVYFKDKGGQGQESLYRISKAYAAYDEEVGYCQGLSFLVAVLLLQMSEEDAFCVLIKLMFGHNHRLLFKSNFEALHERFYIMERLIEDYIPDLHLHFHALHVEGHMYASQWFLTLFTAKFPLPLVYQIMDILLCEGTDAVFQIGLALMQASRKDLLQLDFEGVMKYFRVSMPKKYMDDSQCRHLISIAFSIKISKKRLIKYNKEYELLKEDMAMHEDPVERLQRELGRLGDENMRLERENTNLALEIMHSKVTMQDKITELEEKVNVLLLDNERVRKHLTEAEEEVERLKVEDTKVKDLWRKGMEESDHEKKKRDNIIKDYKEICAKYEERNERLKLSHEEEMAEIKKSLASCSHCSALFDGIPTTIAERNGSSNATSGNQQQLNDLEAELIQTKLALAEARNLSDELELKLQIMAAAAEKPWYKKVASFQSKKQGP